MVKLYLIRGPAIAVIGLVLVVIGANLFDTVYQSVEPLLGTVSQIFTDREIPPNQFINSTIGSDKLQEHNIILVHSTPTSSSVKLEGIDPNGMTFEKESKDGFLYHILLRNNQGGPYIIKVVNTGDQPVRVTAVMGADPFLSNNCSATYGIKCNMVMISVVIVAVGMIVLIVGVGIGIYDFKKETKQKK